MNVSYIITIDFSGGIFDIFIRLKNIIKIFSKYQKIELVVSISLRGRLDLLLFGLLEKYVRKNKFYWCNLIPVNLSNESLVNNSILRNIAVKNARFDYIFFWDVDLVPEEKIIIHASECESDFLMYPVLYLNKLGNIKLKMDGFNSNSILERHLRNPYLYAKQCAIPSSAIRVKKTDFEKVGGFDERYKGHGYEDFDFIAKILFNLRLIDKADFLGDYSYNSPLMSRGFRASFGEFCIDNLLEKKVIFHLFHKKRNGKNYASSRDRNKAIFSRNFQLLQAEDDRFYFPLLNKFLKTCKERGVDPTEFSVFYGDGNRFGIDKGVVYKIKKALYD